MQCTQTGGQLHYEHAGEFELDTQDLNCKLVVGLVRTGCHNAAAYVFSRGLALD
jgi:hypothetical protein